MANKHDYALSGNIGFFEMLGRSDNESYKMISALNAFTQEIMCKMTDADRICGEARKFSETAVKGMAKIDDGLEELCRIGEKINEYYRARRAEMRQIRQDIGIYEERVAYGQKIVQEYDLRISQYGESPDAITLKIEQREVQKVLDDDRSRLEKCYAASSMLRNILEHDEQYVKESGERLVASLSPKNIGFCSPEHEKCINLLPENNGGDHDG
jgi:hypothetical protein